MKTVPVKSIDEGERLITLAYDQWDTDVPPWYLPMGFLPENRFYVENALEDLDKPGEWCFDSEDGVLYFWPPQDAIEECEVVVPAIGCLIDLLAHNGLRSLT
jgi:hypothetical protein